MGDTLLRLAGPAGDWRSRPGARADARGDHHRDRPGVPQELQAAPGQPLPDSAQVPRRGPAQERRAADARVPDEGRVLLPRRQGQPRQGIRQHVRGLLPHLRPLRAAVPGGRGRERGDGRRRVARVHGADRRRRGPGGDQRERRLCGEPGAGDGGAAGAGAGRAAGGSAARFTRRTRGGSTRSVRFSARSRGT